MTTMQQLWQEYHDKIYPHGTHPVQHDECRQAFFTGAAMVLATLDNASTGTEEQALKALSKQVMDTLIGFSMHTKRN